MTNLELNSKQTKAIKRFVLPITAAVVLFSSYSLGSSNASVTLDGEKAKYEEIKTKISSAKQDETELKDKVTVLQEKVKEINTEYMDRKKEFDEAKKIVENKESVMDELKKINSELSASKGEITTIESEINSKKVELASLESAIKVKKEDPVELPAGQFFVGKDIQPGRYKVLPIGRGANFFVYDSNGNNMVNTIIYSDSSLGVSEYVTMLLDGYVIDARSPFKYVPVE